MLASDIAFKHVGKRFRSFTYPNKNKTAKPRRHVNEMGMLEAGDEWVLWSFQFYDNGNIIVNNGRIYLRPDTEVELLEPKHVEEYAEFHE